MAKMKAAEMPVTFSDLAERFEVPYRLVALRMERLLPTFAAEIKAKEVEK